MSIRIMSSVWESGAFDGSTLLLLLALADAANDEGFCWPSAATLMKKTRLSHATLFRSMKELVDAGWIEKKARAGSKNVFYQFKKLSQSETLPNANLSQSEKKLSQFEITPTPPYRSNRKEPSSTKAASSKAVAFELPQWIAANEWDAFEEMRTKMRKPMTDRSRQMIVNEIGRLAALGSPPHKVLEQSVINGWAGVFAVRQEGTNGNRQGYLGKSESNLRALQVSLADQETPLHSRGIEAGDGGSLNVHRVLEGTRKLPN